MTGNEWRSRTPEGPPWSLDLLADLHAGALDTSVEAELRPRVEADPDAKAVLAALDATMTDLGSLPPVTMPPEVAARIEAAIQQEVRVAMANVGLQVPAGDAPPAQPSGQVVSLDAARRKRRQRIGWGAGVLVAAAAVFGVAMVALPNNVTVGTPQAGQSPGNGASPTTPGSGDGPLALKDSDLGALPPGVGGSTDYGPLADRTKLTACLQANGYPPTTTPLAGRQVTLEGKPGVLLVLGDPAQVGRLRLLVVGPSCSASNPDKIAEKTVGR
ncbi:hypothetical protein [Allokutzneria oryzae]|uniref:Anti-sigma-M factor RsmA n=1 Tax=Allokutzneria oryzae TaxID=1378989 RepID=A0ABV6A0D6_9PSEU